MDYTNIKEILSSPIQNQAVRLKETELLTSTAYICLPQNEEKITTELHLYSVHGDYIRSQHKTNSRIEPNNFSYDSPAQELVVLDLLKEFETIKIERGQYKLFINTLIDLIGSYDTEKLFVKQISASRKELKLAIPNNPILRAALYQFQINWDRQNETLRERFVVNFGNNEIAEIINLRFDFSDATYPVLFLKLYNPISVNFKENDRCWISQEIKLPHVFTLNVIAKLATESTNTLRAANFNLEVYENSSTATDYKNWEQLINSNNVQSSQQILDSYFQDDTKGIKLNIDYSRFDNFIHFSSATERVKNFKYKLSLIEYYTSQISTLFTVLLGDIYLENNIIDYYNKRNAIVTSFDDFEKYLFFATEAPNLYTHYNDGAAYIVDYIVNPWPKQSTAQQLTWSQVVTNWQAISSSWTQFSGTVDPYSYFSVLYAIDSQEAETYYADLLEFAEIYDRKNIHKLQNTIPAYIQEQSEEYILFVHMCGQHFDLIWTYLKAVTKTNTHEEHPNDGISSQLLAPLAESLGFKLINSKGSSNLWDYLLNENGNAVAEQEYTNEIWRRIVNNLPHLLKAKGTARSIKSLIACFGVPTTLLNIKEYGGPSTFTVDTHYPDYEHDVFHYAYKTENGYLESLVGIYDNTIYEKTGSTYVSSSAPTQTFKPNILEFRFRTDDNYTYVYNPNNPELYNIASISKNEILDRVHIFFRKEVDGSGTLFLTDIENFTGVNIPNIDLFDNNWHTVVVEYDPAVGKSTMRVAKQKYGKNVLLETTGITDALFTPVLGKNETMTFASGSRVVAYSSGSNTLNLKKFQGHVHEIRLWSGSIDNQTLEEHTLSPASYTYRADRTLSDYVYADSPYYRLIQRFPLSTNHTSSLNSQPTAHPNQRYNVGTNFDIYHPNQRYNVGTDFDIYFRGNAIEFEGFEETYYTPVPSLGGQSIYTDKIRIDDTTIISGKRLNTQTSAEKTSLEKFSKDSNKVSIYFSPQNSINEDIFNQLGYFEIDDFIGNPQDNFKSGYTALINFSKSYWKKYQTNNNFEEFFRAIEIYDFTLFKYIKRMLPLRVNSVLGLTIEPTILERSKIKRLGSGSLQNLVHETEIPYILRPIESKNINELVVNLFPTQSLVLHSELEQTLTTLMPVMSYISGNCDATVNFAEINSDFDNLNKTGNRWEENRFIGKYKVKSFNQYLPYQTSVFNSKQSLHLLEKQYFYSTEESASLQLPVSSSLKQSTVQPPKNKFKGSRISGAGININSAETTDGGPVVTVTKTNPNTIVISSGQITTHDATINPVE